MNNTYIQDRLDDTFRKIGQISGIHPEIVDEFILLKNQSLTDYHNHIVEKIVKDVDMTDQQLQDILSLLQDTNKDNV